MRASQVALKVSGENVAGLIHGFEPGLLRMGGARPAILAPVGIQEREDLCDQAFILANGRREDLQMTKFVKVQEHRFAFSAGVIPDFEDLKAGSVGLRAVGDDNTVEIWPLAADFRKKRRDLLPDELAKIGSVLDLDGQQAMKMTFGAVPRDVLPDEEVRCELAAPDFDEALDLALTADSGNAV